MTNRDRRQRRAAAKDWLAYQEFLGRSRNDIFTRIYQEIKPNTGTERRATALTVLDRFTKR